MIKKCSTCVNCIWCDDETKHLFLTPYCTKECAVRYMELTGKQNDFIGLKELCKKVQSDYAKDSIRLPFGWQPKMLKVMFEHIPDLELRLRNWRLVIVGAKFRKTKSNREGEI